MLVNALRSEPVDEDSVSLIRALQPDSLSYKSRQGHALANEGELEGRFVGVFHLLFTYICARAGIEGNVLMANQEVRRYLSYDGKEHQARSDISGKVQSFQDPGPEEGPEEDATDTPAKGLGFVIETKSLFALTSDDFTTLESLNLREARLTFLPTRDRLRPSVFAAQNGHDNYSAVSTSTANAVFKVLEPGAYAWVREERMGALTNGPEYVVTLNSRTERIVHVSQVFGQDSTGKDRTVRTDLSSSETPIAALQELSVGDNDEAEEDDPDPDDLEGQFFSRLPAILKHDSDVPNASDDGHVKKGSYPADLLALLIGQAKLTSTEPEHVAQAPCWPHPLKAVPRTPASKRPYRTRGVVAET